MNDKEAQRIIELDDARAKARRAVDDLDRLAGHSRGAWIATFAAALTKAHRDNNAHSLRIGFPPSSTYLDLMKRIRDELEEGIAILELEEPPPA